MSFQQFVDILISFYFTIKILIVYICFKNHFWIQLIFILIFFQVLGLYGGGTWGSVKTLLGAGVGGLGPFPCRENEPFWKMPHKGKI